MAESKLAALFLAILAAGTAMVVTMAALLIQFHGGVAHAAVWRSVVVALTGAGVGLSVTAIVHLSLIATLRSAGSRRTALVARWTQVWSAVATGADTPTVSRDAQGVASEAAALVLQELTGEGTERIRRALIAGGVIAADLAKAERGLSTQRGSSTAALERLAWIAVPEALVLFLRAASSSERASRAALLGVMRVLASQERPEDVGHTVVAAVEKHVRAARDPAGARPYLTAVFRAAGDHLGWLCLTLVARSEHEAVRVAALDAVGRSQRPEASEIATEVLLDNAQGETKAAALRVLASVGHVPGPAVTTVVAAAGDPSTAVRVHASYALVGVEPSIALPILWRCLADQAWEVRRAAADALLSCGRQGEEVLRRAAARHSDKFARDVSTMFLGATTAPTPVTSTRSESTRPSDLAVRSPA